ncbi:uncharacterized protein LY79DRAFT_504762 [Colletotrichum navitas]|uniref:Uncharacterized protein n=1 Tax=Colletotrichum navitas TaxID=681940 RepID=A0AAD8VAP2_9PEZI|nr:uncharacterized protein LY79DRAFT_504762 [Colletotrichum navitas]KAK1599374.1 hypothetical protein LY79DRAFT_504762 [Colletotrichum navitas]
MSRFLHVLCSLPLRFLGEFMSLPEARQRGFLQTSYWALARVKASHTPLFFSGEMSAWSSEPADDRGVTPAVWERIRAKVAYKSADVNGVLDTSPESRAAVWRSGREFERQLWTGPMAERERWEGYGHAGRLDPNECYCQLGSNCALCLPLPVSEVPEWELLTKEEPKEEIEEIKYFKSPWLESRHPELARSIKEYKRTHKAVLYRN